MSEPATEVAPRHAPDRRLLLAGGALAALTAAAVTLTASGATDVVPLPGIPVPSTLVTWLVPLLRVVGDLAAVLCVGCLFGAVVLAPGDHIVTAAGHRWVRLAGWAALVWSAAALAALPAQLADFLGSRLSLVSFRGVVGFVTSVEQGRAQFLAAVLAALVALGARTVVRQNGARIVLVVALAATLPPAFTGHTAEESDHWLAVGSTAVHVLTVVLWAGGLVALLLARQLGVEGRRAAVARFSHLALPLAVAVVIGGTVTTYTRLSAPSQLVDTAYGRVVLVKAAALVALVTIGWWHRRASLPALAGGRPMVFLRIAVVEVLIFAVTVGVAVGLSRTPAPPTADALATAMAGPPLKTRGSVPVVDAGGAHGIPGQTAAVCGATMVA